MKLWKENKLSEEWELSNKEIAKRFLDSEFNVEDSSTEICLVQFISDKHGLNSSWEWDKKGSIEGSQDMLDILKTIDEETK